MSDNRNPPQDQAWRPIESAPERLREMVPHVRGRPGGNRCQVVAVVNTDEQRVEQWPVWLGPSSRHGVEWFLPPLPEPPR